MSGRAGRRISVNIKKIKANSHVNRLVLEYGRTPETAEQYDDGHRMIDTAKTAENVVLLSPPEDYDKIRRDRIREINDQRAKQGDDTLRVGNKRKALSEEGKLQAEASRSASKTRKLRSDTVDTLGIVVQMPPDLAAELTRTQQTQYFADCLSYMMEHPEEYGHIDVAVIHYDENSPHMQCLSSTLDMDNLRSAAKEIVGNKTKMSNRQTHLADAIQAKGWDVERGIKRVNNPEYVNFKSDMDRLGIEVNRHNDARLMEIWQDLQNRETELKDGWEALRASQSDFNSQIEGIKAEAKTDRENASKVLEQANEEAKKIIEDANTKASEIVGNANTEASRIREEVQQKLENAENSETAADQLLSQALEEQENVKQVRTNLFAYRNKLYGEVEQARRWLHEDIITIEQAKDVEQQSEEDALKLTQDDFGFEHDQNDQGMNLS